MAQSMLFLLLTLINLQAIVCDKPAASGGGFFLNDKTYSIWSQISVEDEFGVSRLVTFDERYSSEQKRARLEYHFAEKRFKDSSSGNGVIYDQANQICLFHEKQHNHFYKGNLDSLYNYLFANCELPALLKLAQPPDSGRDYFIGPSGLLFLIYKKRNELKLVQQKADKTEGKNVVKIGAKNVVEYRLEIGLEGGKRVKLNVCYDSISHDASDFSTKIPVQVLVNSLNNSMAISFFNLRISPAAVGIRSTSGWAEDLNGRMHSDRIIDLFSFPLLAKRPEILTQEVENQKHLTNLARLLEMPLSSVKFSFVAETSRSVARYSHGRAERHFVAFDGSTMSLRVDLLQTGSLRDSQHLRGKSIYDFRLNRRYFITANNGHSERAKLVKILQRKEQFCSVLEAIPSDLLIEFKRNLSIAKLLLGTHKYQYMGRALVRGASCKVFEALEAEVPFWFDQPFWYLNADGATVRDGRSFHLKTDDLRFTSLIYLSDEDSSRLVALEIYPKDESSLDAPLLRLNFHDFLWDLSDSLDGDKASELFSLRAECCSAGNTLSGKAPKHAEISLMLQEPEAIGSQKRGWILKPLERNEALISSLTHSLFIQVSMLFDFNSKIISDHSYLKQTSQPLSVVANMRVAEHPSVLQSIRFLGFGKLRSYQKPNVEILTESVQSLFECLLMFSHPTKTVFVLYLEDFGGRTCIFEPGLMTSDQKEPQTIENSKEFKLTSEGAGKIFRVAPQEDGELRLVNNWFESVRFNHFENREIILQNNYEENDEDRTIKLRYKRIDVRVFDPANQAQKRGYSPVIKGFRFRSNGRHIKRVVKSEGLANRANCHAACMADFECKSFSLCLHLLDSECLLSNASLAGQEVGRQLNATNQKSVSIEISGGDKIDLIRDFKCEIVNKDYLELFGNNQNIRTFVTNEEVYQLENGAQSCAQICFNKSLSSVQSVLESKEKIDNLFLAANRGDLDDSALREAVKNGSNREALLKSFCKSYYYIDAAQLNQRELKVLSKKAAENPHNSNLTKTIDGFCILPSEFDLFNYLGNWEHEPDSILYPAKQYFFDFASLYQKTHSIRLGQSSFNDQELNGFRDMAAGKQVDEETLDLLKEAIINKKNYQFRVFLDAAACAKKCFVQDGGPWPSCRSFDIIVEHSRTESMVTQHCLLNTMSLDDVANQSDLVLSSDNDRFIFAHYEPRIGFAKEEASLEEEIRILEVELMESQRGLLKGTFLGDFIKFILVLVSLVTGILLGMFTTQKFLVNKTQEVTRSYPTYSMSSLIAKFDK